MNNDLGYDEYGYSLEGIDLHNGITRYFNQQGEYYDIDKDGNKRYYDELMMLHRNYFPAVILSNGTKIWYQDGYLGRNNDFPVVERFDGTKIWYDTDQEVFIVKFNDGNYISYFESEDINLEFVLTVLQ